MTTPSHKFYTAVWNAPGYHQDSNGPSPVFKSYEEAAEYLANELEIIACGYAEGDPYGDVFDSMAIECRTSTEEGGFAAEGPHGHRYAVEETESRGRWLAGAETLVDVGSPSYVILSFTERSDGLGPTAREAAEDVASVCGSRVKQPWDDNFAYAMVDSGRLGEAATELREAGFELVDADGELVEGD